MLKIPVQQQPAPQRSGRVFCQVNGDYLRTYFFYLKVAIIVSG